MNLKNLAGILIITLTLCSLKAKQQSYNYLNKAKTVNTGPYIFQKGDSFLLKWLTAGKADSLLVKAQDFTGFKEQGAFTLDTTWFKLKEPLIKTEKQAIFKTTKKIAVLSDIHGQYGVFTNLLQRHHIIDKAYNWNFGENNLVIVGDIFDRGPETSKALWLIYKLQKQAEATGGRLHCTLGNHEMMVLNQDLRYINYVDSLSAGRLGYSFTSLYSEKTVLGKWLKNLPTILKINDLLFVHGGISPQIIAKNSTISEINKLFSTKILGNSIKELRENKTLYLYAGGRGPLWYRGYFSGKLPPKLLEKTLKHFGVKRIIVGHTSQQEILALHKGLVFAVDSSIKCGKEGMLLFIEDGKFSAGHYDGSVKPVKIGKK